MKTRIRLATILALLFPAIVSAQWSTNPNVNNPISTAENNQWAPNIISDGMGGAIITWEDARSGIFADIYAQRINASGVVQWTTNGVPISTAPGDQWTPMITSDSAGGAIIRWLDLRSGERDIYAQRINALGVLHITMDNQRSGDLNCGEL